MHIGYVDLLESVWGGDPTQNCPPKPEELIIPVIVQTVALELSVRRENIDHFDIPRIQPKSVRNDRIACMNGSALNVIMASSVP
jgi:hypothetical protein